MLKIVMFDIEKMKMGSFSLFLDPFDIEMSLYTYTTYGKSVLGLGVGRGLYKPKKTSNI